MRGTSQLPDLQVCLLSWLLSLHMILKWQPSYLEGLRLLDAHAHLHHPWRAEAGLCECQWISWVIHTDWIMFPRAGGSLGCWCSSSAASSSLPPGCQHHSSACGCEDPLCWLWWQGAAALSLPHGCWSPSDCCPPKDAHARAATYLGFRQIQFLYLFFSFNPYVNLVSFN